MSHLTRAGYLPAISEPIPGPYTFTDFRTTAKLWNFINSPYHTTLLAASGLSITGNYPPDPANTRLAQYCGLVSRFCVIPAANGNLEVRLHFDNWVFPTDLGLNDEWGFGIAFIRPTYTLISSAASMPTFDCGAKTGAGQAYIHYDQFAESGIRTSRQQTSVAFAFTNGYLYVQARHRTQVSNSRNFWWHEFGVVTNGGTEVAPSPLPEASSNIIPNLINGAMVYIGWLGQDSSQVGSVRLTGFTVQEGFAIPLAA